jgi:hypothetical protein
LYSKDNQSLPSTIFNQAHNRKLYFEHRQQGTQLQNCTTLKPLYENSCLNALWKEEDIYYALWKEEDIYYKTGRKTERSHGTNVQTEPSA